MLLDGIYCGYGVTTALKMFTGVKVFLFNQELALLLFLNAFLSAALIGGCNRNPSRQKDR